jgi:competence protein ComEA
MFKQIQNYFDFNRAERNSIVLLGVLLILIFLIPTFLRYSRKPKQQDLKAFQTEIEAFNKSLVKQADSSRKYSRQQIDFEHVDRSIAEQELTPFAFNPNEMTVEKWKQLGLKDWQVKILSNYTSKGGRFFKKEDFQKIYGIGKSEFELLAPYITIPERANNTTTKYPSSYTTIKAKPVMVDLNKADSATLVTLNGIGPSFARRIIKFRNLLGGFFSTSQLLEVYGFDSVRYEQVYKYCSVDPSDVKKLNINSITTDELRKHPYFDHYLAKAIVDRRIIEGKYTSVDQVARLPLAHAALFNKIKNYLTIE